MDTTELVSQVSINRLDGEPVPEDLRILLNHRDELAARTRMTLVADDDWSPWLDTSALARSIQSDPETAARMRATAEVARLSAFVAGDDQSQYLGYWRGPTRRKIAMSPLVLLDEIGDFHLCVGSSFAEAILERAYGTDDFVSLRAWLGSVGIAISWDTPAQLTVPHERMPPKEMQRRLFDQYRSSLLSS
ncbi:MAG: hypothetical protein ACYC61_00540 [Isosphaeraceae bacterium]